MEGRLTVGDVEVLAFTDAQGPFPLKVSQLFPAVRPEQWLPYRRDYPETFVDPDTWHAHMGSYVVRTRTRTMLVDTGLGPKPDAFFGGLKGNLPDALARGGIRPADIDTVITTHLHPDHVGWNLTAEGKPMFPNARYVVHRADWEAFQSAEVQAAFPFQFVDQMITPLERWGVLELVPDEAAISEEVSVRSSPGHTPGHVCVRISSGGQQALILGDVVVHPAQVTEPEWQFAFDMDPEVAVTTRKRILGQMELEGVTGLQCHFPNPGFGLVTRTSGRRHWQPLERAL